MDERLNAHQRYLIEEFAEDYKAHRLGRRDLLRRTLLITGSIPLTASVLTALGCGDDDDDEVTPTAVAATTSAATAATSPSAAASATGTTAQPSASVPGVTANDVSFPGPASEIKAYFARPSATGSHAGILLIHENRGLVEHIRDVARRYAAQGFAVLAVDLLSRQGGTAGFDPNSASGTLGAFAGQPDQLVADLQANVAYLKAQPGVRQGGLGATGFCFGGNCTWEITVASQEIAAAVPFYGVVRPLDDLPKTRAAVLAIYGANDTRVTGQAETVRQRLTAAQKTVEIKIYDGADHAFFNDTGTRYNETAAKDAFQRAVAWFNQYLPKA